MIDGLKQLLLAVRAELGDGVTAEDIADAAWLARWLTAAPPTEPPPASVEPPLLEQPDERRDEARRPLVPSPDSVPGDAPRAPDDDSIDPASAAPVAAALPAAGGFGDRAGRTFGARAAPALPNPLALARALRALSRRSPSRTRFALDTEATVHRFADEGVLIPVLRAAPERWLRLTLVADGGVGGELWRDAVREFRTVLANVGAFKDVRVWTLDADGPEPRAAPFVAEGAPATRHPDELLDPLGGTLTVVMSPFVAAGWRDGSAAKVLHRWGTRGAVVLVPLLPERLWARTALGGATPVQVSAPGPGAPNARLRWTRARPAVRRPERFAGLENESPPGPAPVALPLAPLEPDALKRWAAVLAGRPGATAPGVLYGPPVVRSRPDAPPTPAEVSAEQRLKQFWLTSSPLAQRLAGFLAASPVSVKVLGVIRTKLLPEAGPAHEAEVLFGGLLRRTSPRGASDPQFEFHTGVRELLLNAVRPDDGLSVLEEVSEYLGERFADGRSFKTVLTDPTGEAGALSSEDGPFAHIAADVLLRAGGAYAKLVRPAPRPAPVSVTRGAGAQGVEQAPRSSVVPVGEPAAYTSTPRSRSEQVATPEVNDPPPARHVWDDTQTRLSAAGGPADPANQVFPRPFGKYELLGLLGEGGMGVVYRARVAEGAEVALKTPRPQLADSAEGRERFHREHRALEWFRHPGIVPLLETGEHDGVPYFTMPVVAGRPLDALDLAPAEAAWLVASVAKAVHHAHDRGVVHRNLKPTNVLVHNDQPVVIDFGLALVMGLDTSRSLSAEEVATVPVHNRWWLTSDFLYARLTQSGAVMGTPAYMAPEQWAGDALAIGPRTDVYALGAILYKLFTGRTPFRGTPQELQTQTTSPDPPPDPTELAPELDRRFAKIALRAMSKDPGARFPSADALAEALVAAARSLTATTGEFPKLQKAHPEPLPKRPVVELRRQLTEAVGEAETVALLSRAAQLADPRLAAVIVPRLADRWPEAVRGAARDALRAVGVGEAFAQIVELARRADPALDAVLDGLAVLHARDDLVDVLSQVVDHSAGTVREKAAALLERKRLGLNMAVLAQKIKDARSPLRLQRVLGRGRFADSYLGRDDFLHADVVVRVLRDEFASDPGVRQQFLHVYRQSVQLAHPNLVRTQRAGTLPGDVCYMVRGYVEGVTLRVALGRTDGARFGPGQVVEILRQLLGALDTLAEPGRYALYHGDVQPTNVFVTAQDRVVLGDRGLSGLPVADSADRWADVYRYSAPEVFRGEALGPPADLYSLGCVAYELFCGEPPFPAREPRQLVATRARGVLTPASARRPELGADVDAFLGQLLDPDPARRGTALDALQALDALRLVGGPGPPE